MPDVLLLPLLQAPDAREAERRLRQVLDQHVAPLVARIIQQRMGVSPLRRHGLFHTQRAEDAEDVFQEAMTGIGTRLHANAESLQKITSLSGYVAVATYRAFYAHLRRKYPVRARLKEEVRNTLKRARSLALWQVVTTWIGGLARWLKQNLPPARSPRLNALCSDPDSFIPTGFGTNNPRLLQLEELLEALFTWLQHPVELDSLVEVVALQYGLHDQASTPIGGPKETGADDDRPAHDIPDPNMDIPTIAARNALFARLWEQISALPPHQCAALLLNWKDEGGRLTTIFTDTGVATQRQIAVAMQMPLRVLQSIWDDLPLDDNTIAELLGVTRQQVINLRAAALKRLRTHEQQVLENQGK